MIDKEAWAEEAFSALRGFARRERRVSNSAWTIEEMRICLTEMNKYACRDESYIPKAKDLRWWGPVVQRALREKIIIRKGWGTAKSSNRSPKRRYIGSKWA